MITHRMLLTAFTICSLVPNSSATAEDIVRRAWIRLQAATLENRDDVAPINEQEMARFLGVVEGKFEIELPAIWERSLLLSTCQNGSLAVGRPNFDSFQKQAGIVISSTPEFSKLPEEQRTVLEKLRLNILGSSSQPAMSSLADKGDLFVATFSADLVAPLECSPKSNPYDMRVYQARLSGRFSNDEAT